MKKTVPSASCTTRHLNKMNRHTDEIFMNLALQEAKRAKVHKCVPIGAVIVRDNVVISRAYNQKDLNSDATAHAEILAIRKAGKKIGPNLDRCILYSTLKPCLMCLTACYWSHIIEIVYGTDQKAGSAYFETRRDFTKSIINQMVLRSVQIRGGILDHECLSILTV